MSQPRRTEIVRRGMWAEDGVTSPAAWLSWKVGMAASTAREHVRVALALAEWPTVTAEFAEGRVSYSKVRAIVSTGEPELEGVLVKFAEAASGQQLHRICRSLVTSEATAEVDVWAARDVSVRELTGGLSELRLVAPTEEVLASWQAIDQWAEQLYRDQRDAARAAAAAADNPGTTGDAAAAPEPLGCHPRPRRGGHRRAGRTPRPDREAAPAVVVA